MTSSTNFSSPFVEQATQAANYGGQDWSVSAMQDDLFDLDLDEQDAGIAVQCNLADPATAYGPLRQEYYLLGLASQTLNSPQGDTMQTSHRTPGNGLGIPNIARDTPPTTTCTVHGALVSGFDTAALTYTRQEAAPAHVPMHRYVDEGRAERYAIFDSNQSSAGEWARYSGCTCQPDL
jgi:hypothetical protein